MFIFLFFFLLLNEIFLEMKMKTSNTGDLKSAKIGNEYFTV